jgi:hypothetical protein
MGIKTPGWVLKKKKTTVGGVMVEDIYVGNSCVESESTL